MTHTAASPGHQISSLLPPSFPFSRFLIFRALLGTAAFLVVAAVAGAAELHGNVVGVSDGDTITVLDQTRKQHKVRLVGIDAPEMRQPYGTRARQNLAALVFGKPVVVVWQKLDRYGRIVGHVHIVVSGECGPPGCARLEDVGLAQIESGLAWHYKRYQAEQSLEERHRYARAEQEARTKREGLWKDYQPVPPWEYRLGNRKLTRSDEIRVTYSLKPHFVTFNRHP